jgi:hypothetical protein
VIQDTDEDDDDASDKIYMILELAKYKEIMTWNSTNYDFVPNPVLLMNSEDQKYVCSKYILKIV